MAMLILDFKKRIFAHTKQSLYAPLQRQNHCYKKGTPRRPFCPVREPYRARVRGARGRQLDIRGWKEARGALRQRVGVDALVCGGTGRRARQLL